MTATACGGKRLSSFGSNLERPRSMGPSSRPGRRSEKWRGALANGIQVLFLAKLPPQLDLGAFQPRSLGLRQGLAGTVDIKGQHRKRGAIGAGLAARATLCRAFERGRNLLRVAKFEDAVPQIQRVALRRHALRPASWRSLSPGGLSYGLARGLARYAAARSGFTMFGHGNFSPCFGANEDEDDRFPFCTREL